MTPGPALAFRDPVRARRLSARLEGLVRQLGRSPVSVMHVCGSHEQAIARFGLRSTLPRALDLVMGPGCPVCVTDAPEVDEAVALALAGVRVATFGDMLRVPGSSQSLADARALGAQVDVVYGVEQALELARRSGGEVAFFATGFETTAVATAAALLGEVPGNFTVLSAHKYVPPAMDVVAGLPGARIEGFLAAGHAATITGAGLFEGLARAHGVPVVVAGFEPLDILAALVRLLELVRDGRAEVDNLFPRCVSWEGNRVAQAQLWRVFGAVPGHWRGIAHVPGGDLRLRDGFAHVDARRRFRIDTSALRPAATPPLLAQCACGDIMAGVRRPSDCALFGNRCTPASPVGACMVSAEGTCRIWHEYGGPPAQGGFP